MSIIRNSIILLLLLLIPSVCGITSHNGTLGLMEVHPTTSINPSLQWQYIDITAKSDKGLSDMMDFKDGLTWIIVQEQIMTTVPYTYCDEIDAGCKIKYTEALAWVDVTADYVKERKNGKDSLKIKAPKTDLIRHLRIKYLPLSPTGKWDLSIEDNKDKEILDPWWTANEPNITQGFVQWTNSSITDDKYPFHDTFEDYPYVLIESFESATPWTGSSDATALAADSTAVEWANSLKYVGDISAGGVQYGVVYKNDLGTYNLSGKDTFGIWFYINDSSALDTTNGIRFIIYTDQPNNNYCNYYTGTSYMNLTINDGWNLLTFGINDYNSCNVITEPNGTFDRLSLYTYNDNSVDYLVRYDDFYAYNSSIYPDTQDWWTGIPAWTPEIVSDGQGVELQSGNNGFGYNGTHLALIDTDGNNTYVNSTILSSYTNYEIIMKATKLFDYATDYIGFYTTANRSIGFNSRVGHVYIAHDGTQTDYTNFDDCETAAGDTIYIRYTYNESFNAFYCTNHLSNPQQNWTLVYNWTEENNDPVLKLRARNIVGLFDNIIIRELVPNSVTSSDALFQPSFIYDSASEALKGAPYYIEYYKNGDLVQNLSTFDWDDWEPYAGGTLTPGSWVAVVRVCDTDGYCAYNATAAMRVDLGNILLSIYNESDITQLITDSLTVDLINEDEGYYNESTTSSGTVNYTDVPVGDFEIRYYGTDYSLRSYFDSLAATDTKTVSVYASKSTDYIDIIVQDFGLTGISNATITIQKWDTGLGAGITVAEGVTNSLGQYRFYINKGNTFYKILVSYEGSTIFESDWEILFGTAYRITTNVQTLYTAWSDLDGELTFVNTSSPYYFSLVYNNKAADITGVCLRTEQVQIAGPATIYNHTCLTTDSGTILHPINASYSYVSYAYYNVTGGAIYPLDSVAYTYKTALQQSMQEVGLILTVILFIVVVLGILWVTQNLVAMIVGADLVTVASWIMGTYPFNPWSLGIIIPGSVVIMYYLNKRVQ